MLPAQLVMQQLSQRLNYQVSKEIDMSLELLIYLADVANNLAGALCALSILSLFGVICLCAEKGISNGKFLLGMSCIMLFLLSMLIPSKQTVYMIAGVSASKEVIQSEAAKNAYDLINSYMKSELKKLTGEKK